MNYGEGSVAGMGNNNVDLRGIMGNGTALRTIMRNGARRCKKRTTSREDSVPKVSLRKELQSTKENIRISRYLRLPIVCSKNLPCAFVTTPAGDAVEIWSQEMGVVVVCERRKNNARM